MMPSVSVIIGFKDRDVVRIKKCLDSLAAQTFRDFSVIFVDYGSRSTIAEQAARVVSRYAFARYVYSHTEGMVWNRAKALNTGFHYTEAPYILFGDIDLIYDENFLACAMIRAAVDTLISTPIHFLSKTMGYISKEHLLQNKLAVSQVPIGAVLLLHRDVIDALNGFDEYYCFWGVEDRDFVTRLDLINIRNDFIDPYEAPVLHQWHPIVSDRKKFFFPDRWWDTMNIYYQQHIHDVRRNPTGMGKLFTRENRPVLAAAPKEYPPLPVAGSSYLKADVICSIIEAIKDLHPGESLRLTLPYCTSVNFLLQKAREVYGLLRGRSDAGFVPFEDVFFLLWELIQRGVIADYFFDSRDDALVCTVVGQREPCPLQ